MKHWFITGISRGLGLALAKAALAQGDAVAGTVRNDLPDLAPSEKLHLIRTNLTEPGAAQRAVFEAIERLGHLDVVVNNAGYGLLGAVEMASDAEVEPLFDVNVFAPFRIIRAALPFLRSRGQGHIVNVTSIAGRAPATGSALYAAAKHALEGLSAGLAPELEPLGLKVTAVAPGAFRTDFLSGHSIRRSDSAPEDYAVSIEESMGHYERAHGTQRGDPDQAAQAILKLVQSDTPPRQLLLGADALQRTRERLRCTEAEMTVWEQVTRSTDHEETTQ